MPFRNKADEEFDRDCATFPAYIDYIYGLETRPEDVKEAGIYRLQCQLPTEQSTRNTSSMPSRSTFYGDGTGATPPRNTALKHGSIDFHDISPVRKTVTVTPTMNLRSSQASPLGPVISPQLVRQITTVDMAQRQKLSESHRTSRASSSALLPNSQQSTRNIRSHIQPNGASIPFSTAGPRAQNAPLLRSSSGTDIDEQFLTMMARRKNAMLSSPVSPSPKSMPHTMQVPPQQPQLLPLQQHVAPQQAQSPAKPQTTSLPFPLIQPNDITTNPFFAPLPAVKRDEMNKAVNHHWNIIHNHPEVTARENSKNQIIHFSHKLQVQLQKVIQDAREKMQAARNMQELALQHQSQLPMQPTQQTALSPLQHGHRAILPAPSSTPSLPGPLIFDPTRHVSQKFNPPPSFAHQP